MTMVKNASLMKDSVCEICATKFRYYTSTEKGRFCSVDCRIKWLKKYNTETKSKPNKRKMVFNYYDNKCNRCGSNENLQIHHGHFLNVQNGTGSNLFDKLEDVELLCQKCHSKLHKELGSWEKQNIGNNEIARGFATVFEGLKKKYKQINLQDENLKDTPHRISRAWLELLSGYDEVPEDILQSSFPSKDYDQIILLKNIEFTSVCAHHFLPFVGTAHIAYLPDVIKGSVVGVSKLARLLDCYAKRLQIQELLAEEISIALYENLHPKGVAVIIQAQHMCVSCRGVKKINSSMVTSSMKGTFQTDSSARQELMSLIK